ncbi:chorismate--pyruvate lyase family protein [Mycobacterium szulgai]|uniref:chorismate--pyruvate lyase family protein n=1 Tax=Mycobacterium szulgai TaxID=1787 RepID=UPI0021F2AEC9|nr:chorismate pyruvate-lyase family protein [Mycobacterium szulgai]MCV7077609.1 DUF98 domain-containing protein [Mycobacterium szulgai]
MTVDTAHTRFFSVPEVAVGQPNSPRGATPGKRSRSRYNLSEQEIRKLSRDLRMLIATNGTLTRILSIVKDDDVDVQIVEQQIHPSGSGAASETADSPESHGRTMQRNVLLKGRRSGKPFVAAESSIAIDHLPPDIVASLIRTNRPIGELMVGGCMEIFKDTPEVWMGEQPTWAAAAWCRNSGSEAVGRRYRMIIGGRPVVTVTEYFPLHVFPN